MGYVELILAIVFEIIATAFLKLSNNFTNVWYSFGTIISYCLCFYLFSLSLKSIALGVAYATWCGVGIIFTGIVSYLLWHESFPLPKLIGIILIIIGVVLCNLVSSHH
ncbi:multidrug efflux SMR transporter [Lactobacillus iners]|jgi:quaternary ammonium compound-resistance protein qacG|uniref:DMT family transporter n=1 Tax=Lactobacillus iners TaxID=147802 RepID=UPI0001E985D2|nr:multidrug efflux SMR transporter [Lactobacillus iners]EFQ50347.1 quaternary ammonium compound-resistance protein QacC [Lactobacillus iners LEAF 2062A-h1]EFQ51250.1 quaternary ammonium compound-resistance protein QacC [Lactobacillus iners LEAF 3008A-a]